ncbi:MAG: TPM domain-containing protein [Clostridia bacterium]|nr:TPM domain-containing protein [Clostridia bacterium]
MPESGKPVPGKPISTADEAAIKAAIADAERASSGEIRVHIERVCPGNVMDRAAFIFEKLDMHKTALRNGVLFYLATKDRQFAVIGDSGINAVVDKSYWKNLSAEIIDRFRAEGIAAGLIYGIDSTGEYLQKYFPFQKDDTNELSDEISFG